MLFVYGSSGCNVAIIQVKLAFKRSGVQTRGDLSTTLFEDRVMEFLGDNDFDFV